MNRYVAIAICVCTVVLCSCRTVGRRLPPEDSYGPRAVVFALGQWPLTRYGESFSERSLRLTFLPAFEPELAVTIRSGKDGSDVEVATFDHQLWLYVSDHISRRPTTLTAHGALPESASEILAVELDKLDVGSMGDQPQRGCDGIDIGCEYISPEAVTNFVFGTPLYVDDRRYTLLPKSVIASCYSSDLPDWAIDRLERIAQYVEGRAFPSREISGKIHTFRLYGVLAYGEEWLPDWERLVQALSRNVPAIVDLHNVEMTAPAWEPAMRASADKVPDHSYWVVGDGAECIPKWLGIQAGRVFRSRKAAERAAMRHIEGEPAAAP